MADHIEETILAKCRAATTLISIVPKDSEFINDSPLLTEDETELLEYPLLEVKGGAVQQIRRANDGTESITQPISISVKHETNELAEEAAWKVYNVCNRLGGPGTWEWKYGEILDMKPQGGMSTQEVDGIQVATWTFKTLYTRTTS